ncbi:MAG TPA: hypothetical protein VGN56_01975 [Candidatus Paceibacterota bacterium]|jgi:hypothetical protein|nr:hypothetical protein [Candidatus Paceibacterota bacterium]
MAELIDKQRAHASARAAFERIRALVIAYDAAQTPEAEQRAKAAITDDAPQIAVRSNWHRPGDAEHVSEYRILVAPGSPAVQIIGDIEDGEPYTARLGYQDWFTRWEECELTEEEEKQLLCYAKCFIYTN